MLYDVHSHQDSGKEGVLTIRNLRYGVDEFQPQTPYSVGVHPWDADKIGVDNEFLRLAEDAVAIGECGLDKCSKVPMDQQVTTFVKQIEIASSLHKPMIIHCVKSYGKIDEILKTVTPQTPWIFHGFYGSTEWIKAHRNYDFYYSISSHTLRLPRINEIIKIIPVEKLLLETDEDADISTVYGHFTGLERQIEENFLRLFGVIRRK